MDILIQEVLGATYPTRRWIWRLVHRNYADTTGYVTAESYVELLGVDSDVSIGGAYFNSVEPHIRETRVVACAVVAAQTRKREVVRLLVESLLNRDDACPPILKYLEHVIFAAVNGGDTCIVSYVYKVYLNLVMHHNICKQDADGSRISIRELFGKLHYKMYVLAIRQDDDFMMIFLSNLVDHYVHSPDYYQLLQVAIKHDSVACTRFLLCCEHVKYSVLYDLATSQREPNTQILEMLEKCAQGFEPL